MMKIRRKSLVISIVVLGFLAALPCLLWTTGDFRCVSLKRSVDIGLWSRAPHGVHATSVRLRKLPNIVFLKIHKSGSTTVANILARYALRYHLNIALPNKSPWVRHFHCFGPSPLYYVGLKPDDVRPLAPGQQYHVLFSHMIYNRTTLDRLMPPDTFYFGIMRHPESRFVSAVYYYKHLQAPNGSTDVGSDTASKPTGETSSKLGSLNISGEHSPYMHLLRQETRKQLEYPGVYNSIAYNSGLPLELQMSQQAVLKHAEKLDRELDLMLVMEYFDESLVLLRRRAGLSLKDIIYMPLNARKNQRAHPLQAEDRQALRAWQMADYMLYTHFYSKFWKEVGKEGASFKEEIRHYKAVLKQVGKFCRGNDTTRLTLEIQASQWNERFHVTASECVVMQTDETILQKKLIARADRRYNQVVSTDHRSDIFLRR